jgi:exopolysaccharide biosynthesis polyprenyl glycosylphosphotransferase
MPIIDFFQKNPKEFKQPQTSNKSGTGLIDRYTSLYQEAYFCELLSIERKRSERSRHPFLLMLVDFQNIPEGFDRHVVAKKLGDALPLVIRDTDIKGWYRYGSMVGVIFTEITAYEKNIKYAQKHIVEKCYDILKTALDDFEFNKVVVTWHIFPGRFEKVFTEDPEHTKMYPDVIARIARKRSSHLAKRMIDVLGSLFALISFSPIFVVIAALIKLTSEGPVFFKQDRVGLFGKRFVFFKFRSMYTNNDPTIHREFVKNLIRGECNKEDKKNTLKQNGTYKITKDPRVTPVGSFLRKTSLDELPQFFNVLKGDMSLVGPRPAIPYECAEYDVWHRRRLLEMKPGITGLWQVKGRSTTTFDEMVRIDISYVQEWSLWLDVKLILKTPWAVLKGKGAY